MAYDMGGTGFTDLALCAGAGMLEEGLHLATGDRTICYVEREAAAATALLARMEEKSLAPAPIWCGDLEAFDGRRFRGLVDGVSAGFPCQPWSVAGQQQGHDDERWIWPAIFDIIRAVGCWRVRLENVPGLIRGGGLASVLGDLAALGFDAEWGTLSARAVGANHWRERVLILAYRHDCGRQRAWLSDRQRRQNEALADASGARCQGREDAGADRSHEGGDGGGSLELERDRGDLGDAISALLQGHAGDGDDGGQSRRPHQGPDGSTRTSGDAVFAYGPHDPRWAYTLDRYPHLAPALKSAIRGVADGLASGLDGDIDVEQRRHPQTSPAQRISAWRKLLCLRLYDITGTASPGLFQARPSSDSVPTVPSQTGRSGRDVGSEAGTGSIMHNLRLGFSAQETQALDDLFAFGVSEKDGRDQCEQAMEMRADRLRIVGNGCVPLQVAAAFVLLDRRFDK